MSLLSLHQPDFALHSRNLFVDERGGGRREEGAINRKEWVAFFACKFTQNILY